jgi:hypothetical protein
VALKRDLGGGLYADLGDLDEALDVTRSERVLAIADGTARGDHLRAVLGVVRPPTRRNGPGGATSQSRLSTTARAPEPV